MKRIIIMMNIAVLLMPFAAIAQTFESVKVYTDSTVLPQGETEIIAKDSLLILTWMDGSPGDENYMTLRSAYSVNSGHTFSPSIKIDASYLMADPALRIAPNGKIYLSCLRKDTYGEWKKTSVLLFNSDDNGRSWDLANVVRDDGIFNDRDWLAIDNDGNIFVVYSPRVLLPDSNYDRSVWVGKSTDGGATFQERVLVNDTGTRPPNTAGGSARSIAVAENGDIAVLIQTIPENNAVYNGGGVFPANAYLYISADGGQHFGIPILMTPYDYYIPYASTDSANNPHAFKPFPRIKTYNNKFYGVWIGEYTADSISVYFTKLIDGETAFRTPVILASDTTRSFTLPALEIDLYGGIHVFWIGRTSNDKWNIFYSKSSDDGSTFSSPQKIGPFDFPLDEWPGDFNSVASNRNDVFYSWGIPTGGNKGVYVTAVRNAVVTAIAEDALPADFKLRQNYPNPFNPSTTIEYHLTQTAKITIIIYDINGREVLSVDQGVLSPGMYKLILNGSGLSSGVYFYRLNIGGKFTESKKMVLIK